MSVTLWSLSCSATTGLWLCVYNLACLAASNKSVQGQAKQQLHQVLWTLQENLQETLQEPLESLTLAV